MSPVPGTPAPKSTDPESRRKPHLIFDASEMTMGSHRNLEQYSRDLHVLHDLEGRLVSVTPGPARLLSYSVEELLKTNLRDLADEKFRSQVDDYLEEVARNGCASGVFAVLTKLGDRRLWEYHCKLQSNNGDEQPLVRGIAHDVTARMNSGKALRQFNQKLEQSACDHARLLRELQLFRTLLDHSNDAIEVVDPQTLRLLDVNETGCAQLGYTREELLSMTIFDIDPLVSPERRARTREQLLQNGFAMFESLHRRKDGTTFPVEVNLKRVQLHREFVVAVARNITERKLREVRLQEFERVVESLDEMIAVINRDYEYVLANRAFLQYRGMTIDQVVGQRVQDVLCSDVFHNSIKRKLDECFLGKVVNYELKYTYPALGERHIDVTYLPVEGPDGIDRVGCVLRDVTERKRSEEALRHSEERLRLAHEAAKIGIFERNMQEGGSAWSPEMGAMYGIEPGKAPKAVEDFLQLVHPSDRESVLRLVAESIDTGTSGGEWRVIWPDGSVHWIAGRWRMFKDEQGRPLRALGVDIDITERKKTEEMLRASATELREAQRVALMGSWSLDLKTQTVTASEQLFRIAGHHQPRLGKIPFSEISQFFPPEAWQHIVQAREKFLNSMQPEEIEIATRRPDGTTGWLLVRSEPEFDEAGSIAGLRGIAIDTTERKRAEEALQDSEERLRLAQDVAQIGTFDQNLITGESVWSPRLRTIYGLGPHEVPKSVEDFLVFVHPDDRRRVSELIAQSMESGEGDGEWRVVWHDGTVHWVTSRWRVFKDANGRPARALRIDYDITERKRIEEELRLAKEKLTEEKLYFEHSIDTEIGFEEIVGRGKGLKATLESAGRVATSDATVLLLGETGVGKELVARAIHRLSARANGPFIKMNCAAIPAGLLESELFGSEKGAYTGSVDRKIGRFELADNGTLFLDEIGEVSLALQPKLLRVLQDQEFERLGGSKTLKVNLRLIAATNRNLAEEVRRGQFRGDLYYRLNVFPILVPPLRDRREDIPALVEHFVQIFARRMKKSIRSVPKRTMNALVDWDWPGNVRELENFIERSVILTNGSVLAAPLAELQARSAAGRAETLAAAERKHVLEALRQAKGRISGEGGAAARLGLKRTTLQSKLKQMRIDAQKPPRD